MIKIVFRKPLILMFTNRAIQKQAAITNASKITSSDWKRSGTSVISPALAIGERM